MATTSAHDLVEAFEAAQHTQHLPELRPGDVVRVSQEIIEGDKTRLQAFEGTVIKVDGGYGINGTFTVRRVSGGFGVERIYPFQMPSIKKVEVLRRNKVRRAKLYYLRDLDPKAARLKDKKMSQEALEALTYDADAIAAQKAAEEQAEAQKAAEKEAKAAAEAANAEDTATEDIKPEETATQETEQKAAEDKNAAAKAESNTSEAASAETNDTKESDTKNQAQDAENK